MYIFTALLAISVLANLALGLRLRRMRRFIPDAIVQLKSLHEERVNATRNLNAGLTVETEQLRKKCADYFETIDSACNQRDFWRNWYYRQASEHSNAQSYLLRCVEELISQYRKETGKALQVDPVAQSLVEVFKDSHPRLADAGQSANQPNLALEPTKASLETGPQAHG
jgi:hypothetical protein